MSPSVAPILAQFGTVFERLHWVPLGSGGGFSGAMLWKCDDAFALKAWPVTMTTERLTQIHSWMKQASHLAFVPEVMRMRDGSSIVEATGRVWDLTRWMPGVADFHANPSEIRLANACTALAAIHRAWKTSAVRLAPCPAVQRRLSVLAEWKKTQPSLARPVNENLRRAADSVARLLEPAERALLPWLARPVAIQPCLCDVWHDHVLFIGDAVTGIIDYGAMKEDHVAVDLARLLGDLSWRTGDVSRRVLVNHEHPATDVAGSPSSDLVEENETFFELGLKAYRDAGGTLDAPSEFVRLLDRTGIVCAAINWLLRILDNSRTFSNSRAVAERLARLVARMDAIHGF